MTDDMLPTVGWQGYVAMAVTGVTGALVGAYLKVMRDRREGAKAASATRLTERAAETGEMEKVILLQSREIERLGAVIDKMDRKIGRLQEQHEKCHEDHTASLIVQEQLKGQLRLQESAIRRLQDQTGTYPAGLSVPALVTVDQRGGILECSPGVSAMFHYLQTELTGRNVEELIPHRFRALHAAKMAEAAKIHQVPWPDKAIVGFGLTREGSEFPVTITLSGWRDARGEMVYQAEIHHRKTRLADMPGSGAYVPLPMGPSGVQRYVRTADAGKVGEPETPDPSAPKPPGLKSGKSPKPPAPPAQPSPGGEPP